MSKRKRSDSPDLSTEDAEKKQKNKHMETKQSDPHKEQRIALFVSDAKEVKFTENGRIVINMTTFTALDGLQKEVQT